MEDSVYIVSELCGQWGGSISRAEQMILQSKIAGADAVKVQFYDTYQLPGENRERWEYLSMTHEQLLRLKKFSENLNIDFFASAFDRNRISYLHSIGTNTFKIASMMLEFKFDLCKQSLDMFENIFISLGVWDLNKKGLPFTNDNVTYFHCVAEYPHSFERAIELMPEKFDEIEGFSDHSVGIDASIEAVKRGARYIEKHFTTDHALQSDTEGAHTCSMNFDELRMLRKEVDRICVQKFH